MTAKTATSPVAVHTAGAYRTNPEWLATMGTAKGASTGNPAYAAAVQVATHLAWRAPAGSVAWHAGTNANMVANANSYGATVGTPIQEAMAATVKALLAAATTPEQTAPAKVLAALVG